MPHSCPVLVQVMSQAHRDRAAAMKSGANNVKDSQDEAASSKPLSVECFSKLRIGALL